MLQMVAFVLTLIATSSCNKTKKETASEIVSDAQTKLK
jgi:hypothetical protein